MNWTVYLFEFTAAVFVAWVAVGASLLIMDARERRRHHANLDRRAYEEWIRAMKRLEQYDRDAEGNA